MTAEENWPFKVKITRRRSLLAFSGIIFIIFSILVFYLYYVKSIGSSRFFGIIPVGLLLLFFGIFFLIRYLSYNVEFDSVYTEQAAEGIKADKILPKSSRDVAHQEYNALLDGLNRRGSQIHTAFSILIAASILAVTPLFQEGEFITKPAVFPSAVLPIVSIVLIISTILLHVSARKLDDISWRRINYLESLLSDKNHPWLGHRWIKQMKEESSIFPRHLIWPLLLAAILTFYVLLEFYILSTSGL